MEIEVNIVVTSGKVVLSERVGGNLLRCLKHILYIYSWVGIMSMYARGKFH